MTLIPRARPAAGFLPSFRQAIQRLRGALTELYADLGADPGSPLVVSRAIGIHRNLAWRISRVIRTSDPLRAYASLPGAGGFEILLNAAEQAQAPPETLASVRQALAEYQAVVERHAGDRATLELLLGNAGQDADCEPFSETSRKQAFQGNSAIWGVQARVRMLAQLVAPNVERPDLLDNAMVGGVLGYRRLRPGVTWPIGQRIIQTGVQPEDGAYVEAIDPHAADGDGLPLLREFCSSPLPDLRSVQEGDFTVTELCEGPVGNTGALSAVFGWIHRRYAHVYRKPDDVYGEHVLRLDTPAEIGLLDLYVHRDLPYELPPALCLYSVMHGRLSNTLCTSERHHLPCAESVEDLGSGPPVPATPHVSDYPRMIALAAERLGHPLEAFHGYRVTLKYPPIPTLADLYYERPERPA